MNLYFRKFQDGGQVAPEQGADQTQQESAPPQEGGQQDPMAQLIQAAAQAVQGQDCQTAMQVCQVLVQMAQQGSEAPQEGTADQGEPVYRAGGKLLRRITL